MLWICIYRELVLGHSRIAILEAASEEAVRKRAAVLLVPGIREQYPSWSDKDFDEFIALERKRRAEELVVTHLNGPFVSL